MDDDAIRTLVSRLSRPHRSGGLVIERAAIQAEGADTEQVLAWIAEHGGKPDALAARSTGGGLHGTRMNDRGEPDSRVPLRYVLPADAVSLTPARAARPSP